MKTPAALAILSALALTAAGGALDFAYRLPAEIQTPGPQALPELTWQQGSTPLIRVDVLARGRPVDADTNTTVRMIIGQTATNLYYVVASNSVTTGTSYYVQWPTVGTNSAGTNATAQAWWYTIYFERDGHRYWTGNGDLFIEPTTSTAEDGLTWQTVTSGYAVWGTITGSITSQADLVATLAGYATGTPVYVESDPLWSESSNAVLGAVDTVTAMTGRTGVWNQAAADASSATASVAVLQADLGVVSGAVDVVTGDLAAVSNTVDVLVGSTGDYYLASNPAGYVDASVTNAIHTELTNHVAAFDAHAANQTPDVLHLTAAQLAIVTNPPDLGQWATYPAVDDVNWIIEVVTNVTTNLWVDGGDDVSPDVTGIYVPDGENVWRMDTTNVSRGFVVASYDVDANGSYIECDDFGDAYWFKDFEPTGSFHPGGDASGILTVFYQIATNHVIRTITTGNDEGTFRIGADTVVAGDVYLDGGSQIYARPVQGEGEYAPLDLGGSSTAKTYPVFRLPMGGAWTDFELKASTNNFTNLVYFYISSGTNTYGYGDTNALVYFSDDYQTDVRKWRQAAYGTSIYSQLTHTNAAVDTVYVYPSHDCQIPWADWMSKTNRNLVWSWVRFDGLDFEKNVDGTKQRWNLIRPDSWELERTTP